MTGTQSSELKRVHILIPADLLARVDETVPYQHRGAYVREALLEKLERDGRGKRDGRKKREESRSSK